MNMIFLIQVKENSTFKMDQEIRCPACRKLTWDIITPDQALNKCWNCGLRFIL